MKIFALSMTLSLLLIGCSTPPAAEAPLSIVATRVPLQHPVMPPPVTQTRVDFKACEKGSMLCVTPEEGKTILRNKIATASWARRARDVINYYRSQD